MEKFHFKMSYFSVHAIVSAIANPNLMWRVILSSTAIFATVIGAISFVSYLWASHSVAPIAEVAKDRGGITREEIHTTLDFYVAQQERYNELLKSAPKAPNLDGGGVSIGSEDTPRTETPSANQDIFL